MITDVPKIRVGHATDKKGLTGCTVVLCEEPMVGGVDVRGAAPGTRETDLLRPMNLVQTIHAVVLAGGSVFGLDAVSGVVEYLEENGRGFDVGVAKIPIVPAAVLFDLMMGDSKARPSSKMGYQACVNASPKEFERGCVGAGCGTTVGKYLGMEQATKSGLGSASIKIKSGLIVGAIVAVNAFGEVVDPKECKIIAGIKNQKAEGYLSTVEQMKERPPQISFPLTNTTIGVVATNARLTKEAANKMAQMAHNGLAKTIVPVHTMFDGDTIFALGAFKNGIAADINLVGALAAEVMAEAVVDAINQSRSGEVILMDGGYTTI